MARGVDWRQAAGEAVLIFVGVVVALLGQAWWEHRGDRAAERHFLAGVLADLQRDSIDAVTASAVARERLIAADHLLSAIDDPVAGTFVPLTTLDGELQAPPAFRATLLEGERMQLTPASALRTTASAFSLGRLDLSDATFREAVASGRLDTIRDRELRGEISFYYYANTRRSITADDRAAAQWRRYREVVTDAGLSPGGGDPDATVTATLARDPRLVAELRNLRDHALDQVLALDEATADAAALAARVRGLVDGGGG